MPKLILKSRHRLLCGDSTKAEDVARLTAANERIKHLEADVRRLAGPLGIDTLLNRQ